MRIVRSVVGALAVPVDLRWIACFLALVALSACTKDNPAAPSETGTVSGISVRLQGCDRSAGSLPGWINCRGIARMTITKTVQSGYVSAFLPYPDSGSFYHGDVRVSAGSKPGAIEINLLNNYVPRCPSLPYTASLAIYDGPQGAGTAPLLASVPLTFTSCG